MTIARLFSFLVNWPSWKCFLLSDEVETLTMNISSLVIRLLVTPYSSRGCNTSMPYPTRNHILFNMEYEKKIRKSKVGERGQVTIPQALRTRYGVMPGEEVIFEETKDGLLLRKVPRGDPLRALVGLVREPLDIDEYLSGARGAGWSRELDE